MLSFTTTLRLDGKLASPLPSSSLITSPVGLIDVCNLGNQWIVRVGVCEHAADGEKNLYQSAHCIKSKREERTDLLILSEQGSIDLEECPSKCCRLS